MPTHPTFLRHHIIRIANPTVCANAAGEGKGYKQRVFLVYDGLHYDAFGLNFAPDGPEDFDTTVFSPRDDYVSNNALSIVRSLKEKHLYTDTGSFQLLCGDCQAGTSTLDRTHATLLTPHTFQCSLVRRGRPSTPWRRATPTSPRRNDRSIVMYSCPSMWTKRHSSCYVALRCGAAHACIHVSLPLLSVAQGGRGRRAATVVDVGFVIGRVLLLLLVPGLGLGLASPGGGGALLACVAALDCGRAPGRGLLVGACEEDEPEDGLHGGERIDRTPQLGDNGPAHQHRTDQYLGATLVSTIHHSCRVVSCVHLGVVKRQRRSEDAVRQRSRVLRVVDEATQQGQLHAAAQGRDAASARGAYGEREEEAKWQR